MIEARRLATRKKRTANFVDLPDAEKERIFRGIDQAPGGKIRRESLPLTKKDLELFARLKKKMRIERAKRR